MGSMLFWTAIAVPAAYYLFLVIRRQIHADKKHKEWMRERGGTSVKLKLGANKDSLKDLAGAILICTALALMAMWPMWSG